MSALHFASTERIGVHHFAFYRSWVNGLDFVDAGERYIGLSDPRLLRRTLDELRTSFVIAAQRSHRLRFARLLKLHFERMPQALQESMPEKEKIDPAVPTLEDFAAHYDPDGFYSEAELIKAFEEHYPAKDSASKAAQMRRERWMRQQLDALVWVEGLLASRPEREDALGAWMRGSAVENLQAAGIHTAGDLMDFMERYGANWSDRVARVGRKVAQRLLLWLQENESTLGPLSARSTLTRSDLARLAHEGDARAKAQALIAGASSTPATALACVSDGSPNDLAVLPAANPWVGLVRAPEMALALNAPALRYTSDEQAIWSWVAARAQSVHSQRAYQREAARFLFFLAHECAYQGFHLLSQVQVEDVIRYRNFLGLLGRASEEDWRAQFHHAQETYMSKRYLARLDGNKKPFEGALSARSAQQALIILSGLYEHLVAARICTSNPFKLVSVRVERDMRSRTKGLRAFQVKLLFDYIETLPEGFDRDRMRFLMQFGYYSALRLSELAQACVSQIKSHVCEESGQRHLLLSVKGKGSVWRNVLLPPEVCSAWSPYAAWRKLPDSLHTLPHSGLVAPMLASLKGDPLGESWIYKLTCSAFKGAAQYARERGLAQDANEMLMCSTHDLRHARARHIARQPKTLTALQRLLGHKSLATTSLYVQLGDQEMAQTLSEVPSIA